MRAIRSAITVLARFLLSVLFLASGIHQIFHWQEAEVALLSVICDWQSHLSFLPEAQECATSLAPWSPLLLLLATLFQLIGGLLLLLGTKEKLGAGLLVMFLIPTTVLFHAFWFLEGTAQELQQVMFLKNLAIVGGLLMILLHGASNTARNDGFSKGPFKF